jgi:methyl-accepting chemotaxis protein
MEHAMAELMQEARKSNDAELAVSAGITMRHLLLSRLAVAKYLVDNSEQALVSAQSQMSLAMQAGKNMRRMVSGTKQGALLADFLSAEQGYISALDGTAAAIQSRNEIFGGKLNVIGPEISAAIEEIKLQAKQQQDAIGPAAAAAIDQTHMMNYVLSGLAIVIGSIAALAIARGIVKPISGMTVAMDRLANKDLNVHIPATDHKDEVGDMAKAMQVFKDNMVRAEELSQQQEKERLERIRRAELIETLNRDFDAGISEVLSTVAAASQQLQASASTMTAIASESTDRATTVAAAAEEASANVQTVATAAEELSASISEIGRQVQRSSEIAADAANRAEITHDRVRGLSRAANKIGEVVQLITDIAEQTNLLALNATIEAARAGDAGKGFAVVASEVKNLANQTAKATDEIAGQIGSVQFETEEAVKAIDDIVRIVEEINDVSGSIASAVEEQNAATSEIARNVQEAAAGTEEVTTTIAGVSKAAGEAGAASTQVLSASEDLNSQSRHLQSMVDKFLADVRAA